MIYSHFILHPYVNVMVLFVGALLEYHRLYFIDTEKLVVANMLCSTSVRTGM